MPRTFTLGTLVTRCKQEADMENSSFISDNEWKGIISTVYAVLYGKVAETGLRYFETLQTITTDGSADYPEPSDHMFTLGMDWVEASGKRHELYELMWQERNRFSGITSATHAEAFAVRDNEILLYATPPSGQTYEFLYVPQPADISSAADGTDVDCVTPDGETYVISAAVVKAKIKEESDPRDAIRERDQALDNIVTWAQARAFEARRRVVTDVPGPWQTRFPGDWGWDGGI